MIAGVISRDHGEPWGQLGMNATKWLDVPVRWVNVHELVATQPGVLFAGLLYPRTPVGGDPLPHVVQWKGRLYLEDGHHRVVRSALMGSRQVLVRVLETAE